MSTTIDQKVVEMQFDNKHFEQNVQTSMSTLDKLKKSLKLEDAAKGFDNVSAAAKKVDMNGLSSGVDTVKQRFSAMEVVGVTALANITNSAVNAGKRMLSALTIDPIKTGFSEYELKMDSIKTIMASTGESVDTVNGYLNELNKYSDQTIYSFADMTQNIGKFTNAGVKLEDAVLAIKGISNEAAVSGANAQEASRAMYNFAQALSAGYVKLIDWKSIENANMATVEFKQELINTAVELGVVTEAADGMYKTLEGKSFNATKNFNDVLQDQWMTTDVLVKTLGRYADETTDIGKKAFAAAQDVTKLTQVWDILKETAQSGWARTWELIIGDINEAKELLTPLTNTLSGIIDSFSNARNDVLEALGVSGWDRLKTKLEGLGVSSEQFEDKIKSALEAAGYNVDELLEEYGSLRKILAAIPDGAKILNNAFNEFIGTAGKVANKLFDLSGITRLLGWGAVGEDVKKVQDALEKLGFTLDRFGVDGIIGDETTGKIKEFQKAAGITVDGIVGPETLEALNKANIITGELTDGNEDLILTYEDLQAALTKKSGRELFMESLKNVGNSILGIFKSLKTAWDEIFPPRSTEQKAASIYKILDAINKFTQALRLTDEAGKLNETGQKLMRTFKGVFAIVDILATIFGGAFRIAFKVLSAVLSYFNIDILEFTARIGDALVKVRDWFDGLFDISWLLEGIVPWIASCATAIGDWFKSLKDSELVKKIGGWFSNAAESVKEWFKSFDAAAAFKSFVEWLAKCYDNFKRWITMAGESDTVMGKIVRWFGSMAQSVREFFANFDAGTAFKKFINFFKNGFPGIRDWFKSLYESDSVAGDIIRGLVNGLGDGVKKVWNAAVNLAKSLWEAVKDFLGIHSPSTKFIEIGKYIIEGLIEGIRWGVTKVTEIFSAVLEPAIDWLKKIDLSPIFTLVLGVGGIWFLRQVGLMIGGIGELLSGFGSIAESARKVGRSLSTALKAEAAKSFATALLILVGAIAILTLLDPGKMRGAIGALAVMAVLIGGLVYVMGLVPEKRTIAPFALVVLSLAGVMLALAAFCAIVAPISWGDLGKAGAVLLALVVIIGVLVAVATKMSKSITQLATLAKISDVILRIGITIGILAIALKLIAGIPSEDLKRAGGTLATIAGLVGALIICVGIANAISTHAINDFGKIMTSVGLSILMLAVALKIITSIPRKDVWRAIDVLTAIVGLVMGLMVVVGIVNRFSPGNGVMSNFGNIMIGIGAALLMMSLSLKVISSIPRDRIWGAYLVLVAITALVAGLMLITNLVPKQEIAKIAGTLLAMAGCIAIMAGLCLLLGYVDPDIVWRGYGVVTALTVLVAGLVYVTKFAQNVKGTLVVLAVVIAVLAGAIVGLSFIEPAKLYSAVGAIAILMGMFALMTAATKHVSTAHWSLLTLAGVVVILAGVLALMSTLGVENAIPNAIAVGVAMVAMAASLKIISTIRADQLANAKKAIIALTAMVVPLLVFASAIRGIQAMGINESVITPLLIIGAVIAAMSLLMVPLTLIGKLGSWQSLIGVLALTAMVVPLLAFAGSVWLIGKMGIDQSIVSTVLMLTQVMTVMTLLLAPLTLIGMAGWMPFIGLLALTAMAVPLLAFAGSVWLIGKMNISSAMPTMIQLVMLMTIITDMLVKVSLVAPLAVIAVAAITALVGVITAFGVIAGAIGGLISKFPQLEKFIDTGIPIMEKLAEGLGSILGKFITSFVGEVLTLLPELGTALSDFMNNADDFITGAGKVDESVVSGVGYLAAAIAMLSAADLLENIATFLGGGEDFSGLGTKLTNFIKEVLPAFEAMKDSGLSPDIISSVKTLSEALLMLTGTELLDQISNLVFGQTNEESFSSSMVSLANGIKAFSEAAKDINKETLQNGIDALMSLIDASEAVPSQDWYVKLFPWGRGDEAVFGDGLASLGKGISSFAESTASINADSVMGGCAALLTLIETSDQIPGASWYEKIVPWGKDNNAVFGNGLTQLGTGIKNFANSTADINAESVAAGCAALVSLVEASKNISDATWYEKVVPWAKGDEAVFASGISALGSGISAFATNCGSIDETKVSAGADALTKLVAASQNIPDSQWYTKLGIGQSDQEVFASSLKTLGDGVSDFYDAVDDTDFNADKMNAMSTAITSVIKFANSGTVSKETAEKWKTALSNLGSGMYDFYNNAKKIISEDLVSGADEVFASIKKVTDMIKGTEIAGTHANLELLTSALKDLLAIDANSGSIAEAITKIAEIDVTALNDAVSTLVDNMGTIASDMIDSFIKGIDDNLSGATDACTALAEDCSAAISDVDFSSAGADVVSGFAAGITDNTYKAEAKARAMAKAAAKAAEDELDINSPSKVFRAIGTSVPEGFAQGIGKLGSLVKGSSRNMANTAVESVKNTISNLARIVTSDIDTQPTIRPVMDLSGVRTGAAAIDGMLNSGSMLGVTANVNSINSAMNRRIQNGVSNRDVVTAIEKLNANLGNVGNTSYNINGITYDDGTNIANTISDLIRYTRIERRV